MEEKILRGIQRCPVTAVHHISWLRCPFCLNQIDYCHSCAFLLLSDALPPHIFPTSNIIPLCCPAPGCPPSIVLQTLYPTQVWCTCGGWAPFTAYGILYCSLMEDMANTVLLTLVCCTELFDWFLACYLHAIPKRWTFQKNSCCICTDQSIHVHHLNQ